MTRVLAGTEKGLIDVAGETLLPGSITHVARDEGGWWAIVDGFRILTSTDSRNWAEAATIRGLRANCVLPDDGGALVGTSEAHLVTVAGSAARRVASFDRVPSRKDWYTPWGGPPDVRSLARGVDGRIYAGVHVGGILTSDDGERWTPTSMDVDADMHQVVAGDAPRVAYSATAIGLATTRDGGDTWEFTDEGLHAAYCRAVALAGDVLLLSASMSHTGRNAALYRRAAGEDVFERSTRGLPEWFADNVDTHRLDAVGAVAALGTSDGKVFLSEDAGLTWTEAASGLSSISCVTLV